jgi:2-hydroxy-3-oxopropionate reductase
MTLPVIGFIGLGIMGTPICKRLLSAGYELVVFDIKDELVNNLENMGAERGINPNDVASKVDVVFTMLPETQVIQKAYFDPDGILASLKDGSICVDMSTSSPELAKKIGNAAELAGVNALDAPVSGGDLGAKNGTLSIMVGGKKEVYEKVLPIFQQFGKTINFCGSYGAGQIVKACNQIVVGVTIAGIAEAMVLGTKAGIDPKVIVNVLSGGLARCGILENRGLRMAKHDFVPGGPCRIHYKDIRIVKEVGNELDVQLPFSNMIFDLFKEMVDRGLGEFDHTGILLILEERSGIN